MHTNAVCQAVQIVICPFQKSHPLRIFQNTAGRTVIIQECTAIAADHHKLRPDGFQNIRCINGRQSTCLHHCCQLFGSFVFPSVREAKACPQQCAHIDNFPLLYNFRQAVNEAMGNLTFSQCFLCLLGSHEAILERNDQCIIPDDTSVSVAYIFQGIAFACQYQHIYGTDFYRIIADQSGMDDLVSQNFRLQNPASFQNIFLCFSSCNQNDFRVFIFHNGTGYGGTNAACAQNTNSHIFPFSLYSRICPSP